MMYWRCNLLGLLLLQLSMVSRPAGSAAHRAPQSQESAGRQQGAGWPAPARPLVSAHSNSLYYPADEPASWAPERSPTASGAQIAGLGQLLPGLIRLLASLHRLASLAATRAGSRPALVEVASAPATSAPTSQWTQLEPLVAELGKQLLSSLLTAGQRTSLASASQQELPRSWWSQLADLAQVGSRLGRSGAKWQREMIANSVI